MLVYLYLIKFLIIVFENNFILFKKKKSKNCFILLKMENKTFLNNSFFNNYIRFLVINI